MDRRLLAAVAVVVMFALAGCTTFFGPDPADPEQLSADAEYDYDVDRDAYIVLNRNNYTAVYNVSAKVTGDEGTIQFHRTDEITIERALELRALQFRHTDGTIDRYVDGEPTRVHPNGTTEPIETLSVETTRHRTIVELPDDEGQLAFTTPRHGKQQTFETAVHGSYEIALPPNTDAAIPLLSRVTPSNDDRREVGDRVHLQWDEVDSSIVIVRWYLDRDLWLFGGLALVLTIAGLVGSLHYYRGIERARKRREEVGLDVDYEDDDRDEPPPGMR